MSIELKPFSDFWLETAKETLKNETYISQQVGQDGATAIGDNLGVRNIVLTGFFRNANFEDKTRELIKTFNPKLKGTLTHHNKTLNVTKTIDCKVLEVPQPYFNKQVCYFDVQLECADPFWKGNKTTVVLALLMKLWKFPWVIPKGGTVFARRTKALTTTFENMGDVESGFSVRFTATGSVINPRIENKATGEFIKINYTMQKDDVIEITNYPLIRRVIINGNVNGFRYLDDNSTWFTMAIGTNTFGYFADENIANMFVNIQYVPFYLS